MKTKDQLIQEIEQVPESRLEEVLNFVRSLKTEHQENKIPSEAVKAFSATFEENKEVYRRLANS